MNSCEFSYLAPSPREEQPRSVSVAVDESQVAREPGEAGERPVESTPQAVTDRLSEFDRQISQLRHGDLEDDPPRLSRRVLFWTALSIAAAAVVSVAALAAGWW
jgi:hypothetical protein